MFLRQYYTGSNITSVNMQFHEIFVEAEIYFVKMHNSSVIVYFVSTKISWNLIFEHWLNILFHFSGTTGQDFEISSGATRLVETQVSVIVTYIDTKGLILSRCIDLTCICCTLIKVCNCTKCLNNLIIQFLQRNIPLRYCTC